jgi:hypothetical protein
LLICAPNCLEETIKISLFLYHSLIHFLNPLPYLIDILAWK